MEGTVSIKYRTSLSVRVTYEPDGTPLFCGRDVADVLGFKGTAKAAGRIAGEHSFMRNLVWYDDAGRKRGALILCVDEEGCKAMAQRRMEGNRDACLWVLGDMIQEAILKRPAPHELAPQRPMPQRPTPSEAVEPARTKHDTPFDIRGFEAKLDAVIAQCVMMKAQIGSLGQTV